MKTGEYKFSLETYTEFHTPRIKIFKHDILIGNTVITVRNFVFRPFKTVYWFSIRFRTWSTK